ncbi:hypothetical protein AB0N64_04585 [Microbacterium sp. NPDC089318]
MMLLVLGGLLPSAAGAATSIITKPGSVVTVPLASSAPVDVQAAAVTSFASLPTSGSGVYTAVQVRSGASGSYSAQARTYPDGRVQLSIKRTNGTGSTATQATLSSYSLMPAAIHAGENLTLKLTATGTSTVSLSATAQVGTSSPRILSAKDSSSARIAAGGAAQLTFYTPTTTAPVGATLVSSRVAAATTIKDDTSTSTPTSPTVSAPTTSAYPTADTTGVPKGVTLKVHEGDLVVKQANAVVDGLEVRGIIKIEAPGVLIKNSRIIGGAEARSIGLVSNVNSKQPFTIRDSEIYAATENPAWNGIVGSNFTAERMNIHHVVDPVRVLGDNVTVRSSWLHHNSHWEKDPLRNGTPSHDDSVQIEGGASILLEGNRMEDANNAAVQITQNSSIAKLGLIEIRDNFLQGGGCTVNVGSTATGNRPVIADNAFGPERIHAGCAIVAPTAPVLSGNTWSETGKAIAGYTVG